VTADERKARRRELQRVRRALLPPSEQHTIAMFIDALRDCLGLEALYKMGRRTDLQRFGGQLYDDGRSNDGNRRVPRLGPQ
jgi:hypothetical protein